MYISEKESVQKTETLREYIEDQLLKHQDKEERIREFVERNTCPHCKRCPPVPYHLEYM